MIILNLYFAGLWALLFLFVLPTAFTLYIKDDSLLKKTAKIYFFIYIFALFVGTTAEIGLNHNQIYAKIVFDKKWFSPDFLIANLSFENVFINVSMLFPVGFFVYSVSKTKNLIFVFVPQEKSTNLKSNFLNFKQNKNFSFKKFKDLKSKSSKQKSKISKFKNQKIKPYKSYFLQNYSQNASFDIKFTVFYRINAFFATVLLSFLISISIEFLQAVLPIYRNTELADIIFNTLSGITSATYFEAIFGERAKRKFKSQKKFIFLKQFSKFSNRNSQNFH